MPQSARIVETNQQPVDALSRSADMYEWAHAAMFGRLTFEDLS